MKRVLWGVLALCLMAIGVSAQTKSAKTDKDAKHATPERRAQLRDRIHTVRMVRLVEELDLDEAKALAISKILKDYEVRKEEAGSRRRAQLETLQKALAGVKPDAQAASDTEIEKGIDALLKTDEDLRMLQKSEFSEVGAHLTSVQRAKYLMFRQEFNQAVGDVLRQGRRNRDMGDRNGSARGRTRAEHDEDPSAKRTGAR